VLLVLAAASGTGALAGSAVAATPSRPPSSAIAQYVEIIPTGTGGQAVGVGETKTTPLPPRVVQEIREQAGPEAATIEKIATSSEYGAPTPEQPEVVPPKPHATPGKKPATEPATRPLPPEQRRPVPPASFSRALSLVLPSAVTDGLLSLWLGLVLVTSAAAVVEYRRVRPRRSAAPKSQSGR
jgi:hypothetical protein